MTDNEKPPTVIVVNHGASRTGNSTGPHLSLTVVGEPPNPEDIQAILDQYLDKAEVDQAATEQAHDDVHRSGYEEGYAAGFEEGQAAGRRESVSLSFATDDPEDFQAALNALNGESEPEVTKVTPRPGTVYTQEQYDAVSARVNMRTTEGGGRAYVMLPLVYGQTLLEATVEKNKAEIARHHLVLLALAMGER